MNLRINNIGIIENAEIQINGITVIAGENGTGKSTIGRALYAVFNSFHNIQTRINREQIDKVESILDRLFTEDENERLFETGFDMSSIAEAVVNQKDLLINDQEKLESIIENYDEDLLEDISDEERREAYSKIQNVLNVPSQTIMNALVGKIFQAEFNGQTGNIYNKADSRIQLEIKDSKIDLLINSSGQIITKSFFNLYVEAIYLDDPMILDEVRAIGRYHTNYENHRTRLRNLLGDTYIQGSVVNEILTNEKLNRVYQKVSSVCEGIVVRQRGFSFGYRKNDDRQTLSVANLSTGLKTFVILKTLLIRGLLEENGTIILDEPEIHLHPKWQLLFAEMIVLLHKEFEMHILLNTHSPYFLRAIQVYSEQYGVMDKCNYYLAKTDGQKATITDVTDCIEKIYEKLYIPLQSLEDLRWKG